MTKFDRPGPNSRRRPLSERQEATAGLLRKPADLIWGDYKLTSQDLIALSRLPASYYNTVLSKETKDALSRKLDRLDSELVISKLKTIKNIRGKL